MNIKQKILNKLDTFNTSPFLFVGTGISRRYLGAENWKGLLDILASKAEQSDFPYQVFENEARQMLKGINRDIRTEADMYPLIASLIEEKFNPVWYKSEDYSEMRARYKDHAIKGTSPFKIAIADHFKDVSNNTITDGLLLKEVELLKELSKKSIGCIITTNYDTFLEDVFKEHIVYVGQEELFFSPIQGVSEIYKIHGCCNKPETIIINDEDYIDFQNRNAYLASKLLTMFLEHPIIFLGYSISDKNIRTIFESVANCLSVDNLSKLKERLIFIERSRGDKDEISTHSIEFSNKKKIEMTKISLKNFALLYEAILESKTKSRFSLSVLRKIKSEIYEIVLNNDPKGKIALSGVNSEADFRNSQDIEFVMGVGVARELALKGLTGIKAPVIFRDIIINDLFTNPSFNNDYFVEGALSDLLKFNANSIPIYKYISKYNKEIPLPLQVEKHIKNDYDSLLNINLISQRENFPHTTISGLLRNYDDLTCLSKIAVLKEEQIDIDDLYNFLKKMIQSYPGLLEKDGNFKRNHSTGLKRLIKLYDWLVYYPEYIAKKRNAP
ncbi:MAG TPA: hypothetical protein GX523_07655 [Desulfitobacterium dehalogenans]|uniref:Uncharacterized protein n=1 Tax=Desulfitobacterium dehalogenans TaxID=36854 RepID=A0A7C6Z434_9FIRM|nr:hypothetical protein [Desulfitobacterium dehalogenans]